jgi:hypothetical protein
MPAQETETSKRGTGKVLIREADLRVDQRALVNAFYKHLTVLSNDRRYDWLYRDNPDGPGRVWIAYDGDEDNIIGSGSVIPRRICLGETQLLAGIMADFWIDPQYRTLGPAVQLQRACMASIDGKSFDLCIDFPKNSMVAVYRRLGVQPTAELVRWAKPLRLNAWMAQKIKMPILADALATSGNVLLRLRDVRLRKARNCEISVQSGPCGQEFDELSRAVSKSYGICVARPASYLNWRYRAHFHQQHTMLVARRNGALVGYAVYLEDQGFGQIVDLFGVNEADVATSLIASVVHDFRGRRIPLLSVPLLASDEFKAIFGNCGFRAREAVPVVLHAPPEILAKHSALAAKQWFLMQGDRES